MATCPLCGNTAPQESLSGGDGAPRAASRVTCKALCGGTYEITDSVASDSSLSTEQRRLLAGAVRHAALRGETLKLDNAAVPKILSGIPRLSLAGQADLLLRYLEARLRTSREPVRLDPNKDYSVIYGTHPDDLKRITTDLAARNFIERAGPRSDLYYVLTLTGSEHLEQRRREKQAMGERTVTDTSTPKGRTKKKETVFGDWIRTGERVGGPSGQGDLFIAYHKDDKERVRPHVLKRLRNPERAERFKREVKAALQLDHPGIVKVVAYDLNLARPYLVTPYYRRGHLTEAHVLAMSPADRLRLFAKVCRAVGHAHQRGVVHRDIKPENILVNDDDSPVVADFGLCFFKDEEGERVTETLEVVGSRFFKPPEMEDGRAEDVTAAGDVYLLGKLLYWMFAGRSFEREKHREPAFDLRGKEPRTVHALLYELLDRVIVVEPERRFFRHGNDLAEAAVRQAERMAMDAHVLDLTVPQPCHYCQLGTYKIRVDPRWWIPALHPRPEQYPNEWRSFAQDQCRQYGLLGAGDNPWLVLQCEQCGNVQVFQFSNEPGPLKNWGLKK